MKTNRTFTVLIEQDSDGYYVASVPELPGCHTQAKSRDVLESRVREAILLCLEEEKANATWCATKRFVGLENIAVYA
ncbi:MAG: type II toxin-antitoxin system HicB family antitoxin [Verrucomicrobiia bacterium]